jgi:hypothetical protein
MKRFSDHLARACLAAFALAAFATVADAQKQKEAWQHFKEPAFKSAYMGALGPKSRTAWLARRDGPASDDKYVTIAGERYAMTAFCAQHACNDNNAVLLYQPKKKAVYGTVYEKGRTTYLGDPPGPVTIELQNLWKKEWRANH